MAIWQENIIVIPNEAFKCKEELDLEDWDVYKKLWKERNTKADKLISQIDSFIPRADWVNAEDWIYWKGDTENKEDDDITLAFDKENKVISSFSFRFDMRAKTTNFLDSMIQICKENDWVFQTYNKEIFEPDLNNFPKLIGNSDYLKLLKDPVNFAEELVNKPWNSHLKAKTKKERQRLFEENFGLRKKKVSFWERLKRKMNL